jgi:UDP-N-acetylglucosamine 4,6-dehydratase
MTRFWLSLDGAVDLVLRSLQRMRGGEVFIPKIPSFRVTDLFAAITPGSHITYSITGLRPGEKLHESLIGPEEAHNAYDLGKDFCLAYSIADEPRPRISALSQKVADGFVYSSDSNTDWLTVGGLRERLDIMDGKQSEAA